MRNTPAFVAIPPPGDGNDPDRKKPGYERTGRAEGEGGIWALRSPTSSGCASSIQGARNGHRPLRRGRDGFAFGQQRSTATPQTAFRVPSPTSLPRALPIYRFSTAVLLAEVAVHLERCAERRGAGTAGRRHRHDPIDDIRDLIEIDLLSAELFRRGPHEMRNAVPIAI